MSSSTQAVAVAAPYGWQLVPVEPVTGKNYEAGLWSRRNWECAIEDQPAFAPTQAAACTHRIADARNPIVKSGYLCVDCGAVFSAADHCATQAAPASVEVPDERAAFEKWARSYGTWEVKRDDDSVLGTTGYTDVTLTVAWHAIQARAALAATPAAWAKPVSELLGHISDVLPDNAFDKIDTKKWNAVSALVGAATPAAAAQVVLPEPVGEANLPYFSYDSDSGVEFHETEAEAIAWCEEALRGYRYDSIDGWPGEVESIRWGMVLGRSEQCDVQPIEDHPDFTETCDYQLKPYALLAGVSAPAAQAVEPVYTWTGTEADDAMLLLGRMDDSLEPERIAQLEQIVPRLGARINALTAELAAPRAQAVPNGSKLVPVDLTPEMKREFMDLLMDGIDIYVNSRDQIEIQTDAPRRIWKAVLALSPAAPALPAEGAQAAQYLPLLLRDIARDLEITVHEACAALKPLGNFSVNSAVTAEMASKLRELFPAVAVPAAGIPAKAAEQEQPIALLRIGKSGFGVDVERWAIGELGNGNHPLFAHASPKSQADARDAELLGFLQDQCIDLRCFTTSDGEDVGWRTVQHHMSEPRERVVSEVYGDQPRRAIREAMARIERDPYCTGPLHLEDEAAIAAANGGNDD